MKYLVIVRAGDSSLHPEWLEGNRNWDCVVSYYGDDPLCYRDGGVRRIDHKGSKWQGLYRLLTSDEIDWRAYRYIWLPDDDLRTTSANINEIFRTTEALGAKLAQPALDWNSYYSHLITVQNKSFLYRRSNFVEVMAPCFRTDLLEIALPTFNENISGWGLDFLWPSLLGPDDFLNALILDANPITHTRPVGIAGSGTGSSGVDPAQEFHALLSKFGLGSTIQFTSSGLTTSGERPNIFNSRELLLGWLYQGWQEKFANEPVFQHAMVVQARLMIQSGVSS